MGRRIILFLCVVYLLIGIAIAQTSSTPSPPYDICSPAGTDGTCNCSWVETGLATYNTSVLPGNTLRRLEASAVRKIYNAFVSAQNKEVDVWGPQKYDALVEIPALDQLAREYSYQRSLGYSLSSHPNIADIELTILQNAECLFYDPKRNPRPNGPYAGLNKPAFIVNNIFPFYDEGHAGSYLIAALNKQFPGTFLDSRYVFIGIGVIVLPNPLFRHGDNAHEYNYYMTIILVSVCFGVPSSIDDVLYMAGAEDCDPFVNEVNSYPGLAACLTAFGTPTFVSGCGNIFQCATDTLVPVGSGDASGCLKTDVNLKNQLVRFRVCTTLASLDDITGVYLTNNQGAIKIEQIPLIDTCNTTACFQETLTLDTNAYNLLEAIEVEFTIFSKEHPYTGVKDSGEMRASTISLNNPFSVPCNIQDCGCNFNTTCSGAYGLLDTWCRGLQINAPTIGTTIITFGQYDVCVGDDVTINIC